MSSASKVSVEDRLVAISKALEVVVEYKPDESQRIHAEFDPMAILSKLEALMVYAGWGVSPLGPPYNRVHADVEFWKNLLESRPDPAAGDPSPAADTAPSSAETATPDPVVDSQDPSETKSEA